MIAKQFTSLEVGEKVWLGGSAVREVVAMRDHVAGPHAGYVEIYFGEPIVCISIFSKRMGSEAVVVGVVFGDLEPEFRPGNDADFYWATDSVVVLSRHENAKINEQLGEQTEDKKEARDFGKARVMDPEKWYYPPGRSEASFALPRSHWDGVEDTQKRQIARRRKDQPGSGDK